MSSVEVLFCKVSKDHSVMRWTTLTSKVCQYATSQCVASPYKHQGMGCHRNQDECQLQGFGGSRKIVGNKDNSYHC